jgi:hypothetical protein
MGGAAFAPFPFFYIASGGIIINSTAIVRSTFCFYCRFGPGSLVFLKEKANRGILEKIIIKKTRVNTRKKNCWPNDSLYGSLHCMYFDNLNEVYEEEELFTQREALMAARRFYESLLEDLNQQPTVPGLPSFVIC